VAYKAPTYRIAFKRDEWGDIKAAIDDVARATKSASRRKRLEALSLAIAYHFSPAKETVRRSNLEAAHAYRKKHGMSVPVD